MRGERLETGRDRVFAPGWEAVFEFWTATLPPSLVLHTTRQPVCHLGSDSDWVSQDFSNPRTRTPGSGRGV